MSAVALKFDLDAVTESAPAPVFAAQIRQAAAATDAVKAAEKAVEKYERQALLWKARNSLGREKIASSVREVVADFDDEQRRQIIDILDVSIEQVSAQVVDFRARVAEFKALTFEGSSGAVRLLRKVARRGAEIVESSYDTIVDSYYFLIALRAEVDPDTKPGKFYENADDLIASL